MNSALPTRAILVATDLTASSDPVMRAAAALCALTGATLHVLHAFDLPPSPYIDGVGEMVTFQARLELCEKELREQIARTVPDSVTVGTPRLEIYAAHRAIAEAAEAVEAELVVIGPHSKRDMEIAFLGGTADRVLRTLEVPCLVVRGDLRMPLRHVVVPMDLSESSHAAMDVAVAWALGMGGHRADDSSPSTDISVVHVIPEVLTGPGLPFERAEVMPGWNKAMEEMARNAGPDVRLRETVLFGNTPADEIVKVATEERADVVVMSTHGYGAIKRAILGSTAQAVARRAPCPVLMVPPRMWTPAAEAAAPAQSAAEMFAPPPV